MARMHVSAAVSPRDEPFDRYLAADVMRLGILLLLVYLIAVVSKVAYLRWRNRKARRLTAEQSPWALLSYVAFMLNPWFAGLGRFGQPLDVVRTVLTTLGLLFGVIAAYRMVTLQGWAWPPQRFYRTRRTLHLLPPEQEDQR